MNPTSSSYTPYTLLQKSPHLTDFTSQASRVLFRESKLEGLTDNLSMFFAALTTFCRNPAYVDWSVHQFNRLKRLRIAHQFVDLGLTSMDIQAIIQNALKRTQFEIETCGMNRTEKHWLITILHRESFRLHYQVQARALAPLPLFYENTCSDR